MLSIILSSTWNMSLMRASSSFCNSSFTWGSMSSTDGNTRKTRVFIFTFCGRDSKHHDVSMPNCGHVTNRVHALQSHGADGECSGMTDLLHHALQGRAMSCPMTSLTEFCRCPTHFQKSHHIMTSLTELCRWPTEFWDHAIP